MATKSKKIIKLLLKNCSCDNCAHKSCVINIHSGNKAIPFSKNGNMYCEERKTKPLDGVCAQWKLFRTDAYLYKIVRGGYPSMIAEEITNTQPIGASGQTFLNWASKDEKQI